MLSYCLKCKENAENINTRVSKTSNNKTMLLTKQTICSSKKLRFIKKPEVSGIFSSLGLKTPFLRFCYLVIFCFQWYSIESI